MARFGVGVGAFLIVLGAGASAEAQWSSVVLDFEGRGHRQVRNALLRVVEDRVTLESADAFAAAAAEAGADLSTAAGISATARSENVSMVITGVVTGRNTRSRATIRFLDADGEELSAATTRSPRNQSARQRFDQEVTAAFERALDLLDERAATERDAEMARDTAEVVGLDDERSADDDSDDGVRARSYPLIRGLFGLDGRGRNATIDLANGLRRTYQAFFAQLTLTLEVRPFGPKEGYLEGLFIAFDGAAAVGLTSNEQLSSGAIASVDTSAYRFAFLVGYLFDLEAVELGASVGFTYDAFELGPNTTIPTSAYSSLRVGVLGRLPIMGELLGAFVEGGLRVVLGTGDLTPTFGQSSSGIGFDVVGGLMGALDMGFTYAARLGYVGYSLGFSGNGAVLDETATGGFDGGLYVGAQVGWQL